MEARLRDSDFQRPCVTRHNMASKTPTGVSTSPAVRLKRRPEAGREAHGDGGADHGGDGHEESDLVGGSGGHTPPLFWCFAHPHGSSVQRLPSGYCEAVHTRSDCRCIRVMRSSRLPVRSHQRRSYPMNLGQFTEFSCKTCDTHHERENWRAPDG